MKAKPLLLMAAMIGHAACVGESDFEPENTTNATAGASGSGGAAGTASGAAGASGANAGSAGAAGSVQPAGGGGSSAGSAGKAGAAGATTTGGGGSGGGGAGSGSVGGKAGSGSCGQCAGCCQGSTCVVPTQQDWPNCGSMGQSCGTCGKGSRCSAGKCDEAHWSESTKFLLKVSEIHISTYCSDPIGAPDPYATMTLGGKTSNPTPWCAETYTCIPNSGDLFMDVLPTHLTSGTGFVMVSDFDDGSADDYCWQGKVQFPSPLPKQAYYEVGGEIPSTEYLRFTLTPQ